MADANKKIVALLKAYRKEMNIRQEDMGLLMGVNQSHYCKFESGDAIISYRSLETFQSNKRDIDYLVTGEKTATSILDKLMEQCPYELKPELLELIYWAVNQGLKTLPEETVENDYKDIEILRQRIYTNQPIWYILRKVNQLTQEAIAARLGMNIKHYRKLEKEEVFADILDCRALYENMSYLPSLVVGGKAYSLGGVNKIWNRLDSATQEVLYDYIQEGLDILLKLNG